MTENAKPDGTPAPPARAGRIRTALADTGTAARRTLSRLRGAKRPGVADEPKPAPASAADAALASPTDLADADVAVQRAWGHVRLVIVIVATVAPVVMALVSWRISVWRAQRR